MTTDEPNIPTFQSARETLSGLLDGWVFGTVRSMKMVDPEAPYYHGILHLNGGERVWFQSSRAAKRVLKLGPVHVQPSDLETHRPQVGDVVMGKLNEPTQGDAGGGGGGGGRKKRVMHTWYSREVAPLRKLKDVCVRGTHLHEFQLLGDMRRDDDDDVWALCRLVIYGNMQAFVDAHNGVHRLRLGTDSVDTFVHQTSSLLCDDSVWDTFASLVPDAQPETPDTEPPLPPSPAQYSGTAYPSFGQDAYDPVYPLYAQPPPLPYNTPLYTPPPPPPPQTPPYTPASPPYTPASPPYTPVSPPYMPQTP